MSGPAIEAASADPPDIAGLEPVERIRRRWPMLLGAALVVLMIAGLARELFRSGLSGLWQIVPENPLFYVAFALFYLIPPTFDYIIFRRLWRIPFMGMIALHKKRISNEVLVGYSGEAYFYAWARQRTRMVAAPFGAVKDVAILSALAGHAVTLVTVAIAIPFGMQLLDPQQQSTLFWSVLVIVGMTLPFVIFSKRIFSLATPLLWWIFNVQNLRLVLESLALAFAWYFALPEASIALWLVLVAGRLLATRLPFLPNKELLFANIAIIMFGEQETVTHLLAFTAALTLLCHVALIGVFSVQSVLRKDP